LAGVQLAAMGAGHPRLLARLTRVLADDGQLGVQVPANHDQASHIGAAELAREQPYATRKT
jgi:trans-aconitate methyltransferase